MMVFKRLNKQFYPGQRPYEYNGNGAGPLFADWSFFPQCFDSFMNFGQKDTSGRWNTLLFSLLLTREDVDVNTTDSDGNSLLALSIKYQNKDCFNRLLQIEELDVNAKNDNGQNVLLCNFIDKKEPQVQDRAPKTQTLERRLMSRVEEYAPVGSVGIGTVSSGMKNASWDIRPEPFCIGKPKPLGKVSGKCDPLIAYFVEKLLDREDFDLNDQDFSGNALIHHLVKNRMYKQLQKILDLAVTIDVQDCYGNTPLMYAVSGEIKFYKLLLDKGANKEISNYEGRVVEDFAPTKKDLFTYYRVAGISLTPQTEPEPVPQQLKQFIKPQESKKKGGWFT